MRLSSRILAVLMTLQVASAWSVPAGVLCVADDGHLALKAIEAACSHPGIHAVEKPALSDHEHPGHHEHHEHSGHHEHDEQPAQHEHGAMERERVVSDSHHCHPCVDVALSEAPPAQPCGDESPAEAPPVMATHPALGLASRAPVAPTRIAEPPALPAHSLRALRSVVLTC